jgi:DNA-binding NarL/FixJ family response regulator
VVGKAPAISECPKASTPRGGAGRFQPRLSGGIRADELAKLAALVSGARINPFMETVAPTTNNPPTRIGIVEDHELMRSGMRSLLGRREGFEVVMEAASAAEAYEKIAAANPMVLTVDLEMPGEDGIAMIRKIRARWPQIKFVIFTGSTDDRKVTEAFLAGAEGFLRKENRGQDLVDAIQRVSSGKPYLCSDAARVLMEAMQQKQNQETLQNAAGLSDRETSVLRGIAEGLSYKEIGDQLGISVKSVDTYRSRMAVKLGCSSRAELIRQAVRLGIVSL